MNEWGLIGKDTRLPDGQVFVGIGKSGTPSPPQVLNLNQGVPACRQTGLCARLEVSAF